MVMRVKWNLVRYLIKVCLIWMLELRLGFTIGMGGVTASAAYLHHVTINGSITEAWSHL